MTRITAAILIAGAAFLSNGALVRDVLADDQAVRFKLETAGPAAVCAPAEPRATRILSLLVCLEALRQVPVIPGSTKV